MRSLPFYSGENMEDTIFYLINGILVLGAGLLCLSFSPLQRLIEQLPPGALRKRWNDLRALIVFFIISYMGFTFLYWIKFNDKFNLIVPAVFFYSSVMIVFVGSLALQTTNEIKRVATLQHENITDHLIGINNRRYLDRKIAEEFLRARRYALPLSMLLLDIDHFKTVNDNYGHPTGDLVLSRLGKLLFKKVRDTDILARYGGEEIAILAPQTSISSAVDLAERLRQAVEATIMVGAEECDHGQVIAITVSIGVAGMDQRVNDQHLLVEHADKALYDAKHGGRNKVMVFGSA